MKRRVINLRSQTPLLDVVSYGRGRHPLTPAQRAYVARTVRRVPEVLVKVSGGSRTLAGVERHMKYIEKKGALGLETDQGTRAGGEQFARHLAMDWDLDIEALKRYSKRFVRGKPPKLVHNIIFSMPAGHSPQKVLAAVRKLALNEWALQHRYAMALHTDEPHPHVHVILKAVSEEGVRLNIKKATLRGWRAQFAANLRELGVAANATERAVRGETRTHKLTAIYRAAQRGDSSHIQRRQAEVLREASITPGAPDPGYVEMKRTREDIVAGWRGVESKLSESGDHELADDIHTFVDRMAPVQTEKALLVERVLGPARRSWMGTPERSQ
jgi:hypothetical protein